MCLLPHISRKMAELKESYQEKLENTFELYKDALKEHAYQCALERVEEEYIPVDEFIAEQEKVEVDLPSLYGLISGPRVKVLISPPWYKDG